MPEYNGTLLISTNKKGQTSCRVRYITAKQKQAESAVPKNCPIYDGAQNNEEVIITIINNNITSIKPANADANISINPNNAASIKPGILSELFTGSEPPPPDYPGTSPYNFTPYIPGQIVAPKEEARKWSGEIHCSLEAITPLLVCGKQEKTEDKPTHCRFLEINGKPVIPGTSLKGMLRSVMEILSYSGMQPMNDEAIFWRNVAKSRKYRNLFPPSNPKNPSQDKLLGGLLHLKDGSYLLTPTTVTRENKKNDSSSLEVGKAPQKNNNRWYYFEKCQPASQPIPLKKDIVERLWTQMTPAQEKLQPAEKREKLLQKGGLPVFYRTQNNDTATKNNPPVELGFCRYFRTGYKYTPFQLAWPDKGKLQQMDICRQIFGQADKGNAFAGRVAVSPCMLKGEPDKEYTVILGSPKPSYVPFYLIQEKPQANKNKSGYFYERDSLNDYNEKSSRLRGRKLYWHHEKINTESNFPKNSASDKENEKMLNILHPLKARAAGEFVLRIKRLTDTELGCLLEALELQSDCCHRLGMAKPLGFGSVKITITDMRVEDVSAKYASLANRLQNRATAAFTEDQKEKRKKELRQKFRQHILESLGVPDKDYYQLAQIHNLFIILNYKKKPDADNIKYMSVGNFGRNLVLPYPDQII